MVDVMSEDYVIEWDKNFCRRPRRRQRFLSHNPTLWPNYYFPQLRRNLKSFEDEDEDEYGRMTSPDCSGGDPEITSWHRHFCQVLRGEGFIHLVD